jgi:hypothetical protein
MYMCISSVYHYNHIKFMRIKMIGVTQEIIINKTINSAFYASCRLIYFVHIPSIFYLVHCIFDAYHHWHCEFKSSSGWGVQHYVIKFVSDLWQVCGFLRVLRFPPPIKLTATILLKVALDTIKNPQPTNPLYFGMNRDGIYLFLVGVKQQSLIHSIPRYLILDWHIIVWS